MNHKGQLEIHSDYIQDCLFQLISATKLPEWLQTAMKD